MREALSWSPQSCTILSELHITQGQVRMISAESATRPTCWTCGLNESSARTTQETVKNARGNMSARYEITIAKVWLVSCLDSIRRIFTITVERRMCSHNFVDCYECNGNMSARDDITTAQFRYVSDALALLGNINRRIFKITIERRMCSHSSGHCLTGKGDMSAQLTSPLAAIQPNSTSINGWTMKYNK